MVPGEVGEVRLVPHDGWEPRLRPPDWTIIRITGAGGKEVAACFRSGYRYVLEVVVPPEPFQRLPWKALKGKFREIGKRLPVSRARPPLQAMRR